MRTTKRYKTTDDTVLVTTLELAELLHSGRKTAVGIGEEAEARVQIGKRVFWNLPKVKEYLNIISL